MVTIIGRKGSRAVLWGGRERFIMATGDSCPRPAFADRLSRHLTIRSDTFQYVDPSIASEDYGSVCDDRRGSTATFRTPPEHCT